MRWKQKKNTISSDIHDMIIAEQDCGYMFMERTKCESFLK